MRRLIILMALITALALPAQSIANGVSPSASGAHQYHRVIPTAIGQQPQPAQPVQPVQPVQAQSTLPFTGEDVLLVVLAGLLLTAGGFTLYRQAKHR